MLFGIEQLDHRPLSDKGQWLWRGRFLFDGPARLDSVTPAYIERLTSPFIEAEADGWHVWVPTPGREWATHCVQSWPYRPPKPYLPSWEDYRKARREQKLDWIYQFLVEFEVPVKHWDKHIKKVAKCRI